MSAYVLNGQRKAFKNTTQLVTREKGKRPYLLKINANGKSKKRELLRPFSKEVMSTTDISEQT